MVKNTDKTDKNVRKRNPINRSPIIKGNSGILLAENPKEGLIIIEYFKKKYSEKKLNAETIALELNIGPNDLNKYCCLIFGMPAIHCLEAFRIYMAVNKILDGKSQYWYETGFSSPFTFTRSFKRKTGITKKVLKERLTDKDGIDPEIIRKEIATKIWKDEKIAEFINVFLNTYPEGKSNTEE